MIYICVVNFKNYKIMKEKTWILEGNPFDYTARITNDKLCLVRNDHKAFFDFNKEDVLNVKNLSRITGSNHIAHCITVNVDNSIKIGCCTISNTKYKEICEELTKDLIQIKTEDMKFKVGDKVKIVKTSQYYRDNDVHNPKTVGVIESASEYTILVKWEEGLPSNSYGESDLELVHEIQEIQEMKKYIVLKDFDGKKAGNVVELPNTTIQWLDSNEFVVNTTLNDLISKGFIELYKDYKNGDWVYFEKPNKSYGVFMYDGKVENSASAKNAVYYYNENSEISIIREISQRWCNFKEVKRLATKDEIKKALTDIAKSKGFKKDTKFVSPENDKEYTCNGNFTYFHSSEGDHWLLCNNTDSEVNQFIYYKGVWAEIIKEEVIEIVGYEPVFNSNGTVSIGCNKDIPAEVFKGLKAIQDFCIRLYSHGTGFRISKEKIEWFNGELHDCTKGVHAVVNKLK